MDWTGLVRGPAGGWLCDVGMRGKTVWDVQE